MSDFQGALFNWVTGLPAPTTLLIFILGFLYGFFGFRFFRALLTLSCAGIGYVAGGMLSDDAEAPSSIASIIGAALFAVGAVNWQRPGVFVANGMTWAALGMYLAQQFGLEHLAVLVAGAVCGGFGVLFAWLCFRSMTVVLTTLQGAILIMIGFVGVSSSFMPTLGATFKSWAADSAWVVPVMLLMVAVTAYSYQAMHERGDIRSGT